MCKMMNLLEQDAAVDGIRNGIMKNQPTLFQQAWKTHIKEEVKEEGKKDKTDEENKRQNRD